MRLDRRRALQLGGVAGVAALAGCIGPFSDDDGDDPNGPAYTSYVAPNDDDEVFFIYFDLAEEDADGETGEFDDPMLAPVASGALALLGATIALDSTGLEALLGIDLFEEETDDEAFETEIEGFLLTGRSIVLLGDLDHEEIEGILNESASGGFTLLPVEYHEVDEVDGYTIYKPDDEVESALPDDGDDLPGEGDVEGEPVAVGDGEIVVGPSEDFDRIRRARNGDGRATGNFEEFEWLVSAAAGEFVVGEYAPDGTPEEDATEEVEEGLDALEADVLGIVSAVSREEDGVEATLAAVFDGDLGADAETTVEEVYGVDATEVDIDIDDDRLTVAASYASGEVEPGS